MGWGKIRDVEFVRLGREITGPWPPTLREIHMRRLLDPDHPGPIPSAAELAVWWGVDKRTVLRVRKRIVEAMSPPVSPEVSPPVTHEPSEEAQESGPPVAVLSPPVSPPVSPPTTERSETERLRRGDPAPRNGSHTPALFGDIPTATEAVEDQVTRALTLWGEDVNRQIGRRAATAATYTTARKWVRKAIQAHSIEAVLESFRYLAHHPDNDSLRRKARRKGAPFLKIRWWLAQGVAEHAHNNQGHDGHTSTRSLDQARHESGGMDIPL